MENLTFGIIKPDAVKAGVTGSIIQRIIDDGFRIRALKLIYRRLKQAEGFYAVQRGRPSPRVNGIQSSGPCLVMALEKTEAVPAWRI